MLNLKIKSTSKLERNPLILSLSRLLSLLASAEVLMDKWAQEMFHLKNEVLWKSFFSWMRFYGKLCDFTFRKTFFHNSSKFENIRGKIKAKAEKKKGFSSWILFLFPISKKSKGFLLQFDSRHNNKINQFSHGAEKSNSHANLCVKSISSAPFTGSWWWLYL